MTALLSLILLTAAADAPALPGPDVTGVYTFETHQGGEAYEGLVTVRAHGDAYAVQYLSYKASEGNGVAESVSGVGVLDGSTLSVGWALPGPGGQVLRGVSVYRITRGADGKAARLLGRWSALPGGGVVREEELKRAGDLVRH